MRIHGLLLILSFASPCLPQMRGDWQSLTQSQLDDAYNQSVYAPNLEQVIGRYQSISERARDALGEPEVIPYGDGDRETALVFKAETPGAPIHAFVHGGAWKLGAASENLYLAPSFVHAGANFVALDFAYVQDFDGRLEPIVDQLGKAIAWI